MTRERVWLTLNNTQTATANSDVEVETSSNVVFVDFGRNAAANKSVALAA